MLLETFVLFLHRAKKEECTSQSNRLTYGRVIVLNEAFSHELDSQCCEHGEVSMNRWSVDVLKRAFLLIRQSTVTTLFSAFVSCQDGE